MQIKVFTIPISNPSATEESVNAFLRSRRVVNVTREFVPNAENSLWTIMVEYLVDNATDTKKRGKVDYREVLNREQFALFSQLREIRKKIAEERGVPVYTVFTNEQLASIATNRPGSLDAIRHIPGIGSGKAEQFGEMVIQFLNGNEAGG